jgi:hypothetical protein
VSGAHARGNSLAEFREFRERTHGEVLGENHLVINRRRAVDRWSGLERSSG